MPVLINFKICDNAKECNGIAVCPTGALSWDDSKKTIVINNDKCISCRACEKACMVDAIRVAKTEAEYKRIKKEIENDPRKVSDLFVDRYGAQPVSQIFIIPHGRFELEVLEATKITVVECFNNDSIKCLLYSIPIRELFKNIDIKYRKMEIKDDSLIKKYKLKKLPALLFFRNGKLIGKIEGYYEIKNKKELMQKLNKILKL